LNAASADWSRSRYPCREQARGCEAQRLLFEARLQRRRDGHFASDLTPV
jgi:hypothetical protein